MTRRYDETVASLRAALRKAIDNARDDDPDVWAECERAYSEAGPVVQDFRELVEALRDEWEMNHDERCSNMHRCDTYGLGRECCHPPPGILKRFEGVLL